jgi:hypothetical protein
LERPASGCPAPNRTGALAIPSTCGSRPVRFARRGDLVAGLRPRQKIRPPPSSASSTSAPCRGAIRSAAPSWCGVPETLQAVAQLARWKRRCRCGRKRPAPPCAPRQRRQNHSSKARRPWVPPPAAQVREKKRVIEHQHVRRQHVGCARAEKAGCPPFFTKSDCRARIDLGEHRPRSEQTCCQTLGSGSISKSDRLPSSVFWTIRNALQLLHVRRGEKLLALLADFGQAARAKIIVPALEHREMEFHRQNLRQHRQVLLNQLLLQIDRVGGNDRLLACRATANRIDGIK